MLFLVHGVKKKEMPWKARRERAFLFFGEIWRRHFWPPTACQGGKEQESSQVIENRGKIKFNKCPNRPLQNAILDL
jgi:hypothetical protein